TSAGSHRPSIRQQDANDHTLFANFFFQAEDGIRDKLVTGVQTCALPISLRAFGAARSSLAGLPQIRTPTFLIQGRRDFAFGPDRSEERRVGKEGRSRLWPAE